MTRCKGMSSTDTSHILGKRQCLRKAWRDGYCRIHHPDTTKAKNAVREAQYKKQQESLRRRIAEDAAIEAVAKAALLWDKTFDGSEYEKHLEAGVKLREAVATLKAARKR
jgi:hypothetical protein